MIDDIMFEHGKNSVLLGKKLERTFFSLNSKVDQPFDAVIVKYIYYYVLLQEHNGTK